MVAVAFASSFLASQVRAQSAGSNIKAPSFDDRVPTVVVTANPLESDLFDLAAAVSVLSGEGLALRRQSTLGETLAGTPGVASSYFGPNASRPMIRGLDGDRIRILQNGVDVLDVSSLSNDHATAIDPLFIDRIEVVRGPAALLHGGNAIGGVVNVIDRRIVRQPLEGIDGAAEFRLGGPDQMRAGAVMLDVGNGRLAFHVDAYERRTSDLNIPGYARSARQRAIDDPDQEQARDTLPNSASDARGGAIGASVTGDNGYVGLSLSTLRSDYGVVAEPDVTIGMRQERVDLSGELRRPGWIRKISLKAGWSDYAHNEFEDGVVATTFENKGYEARIEATHAPVGLPAGTLTGAFGVQTADTDFSALGEEAYAPQTNTRSWALFLYEQWALGNWKLSGGGRLEETEVASSGGGAIDASTQLPRFGAANVRKFSASSVSLSAVYRIDPELSLVFSAASSQRAPTYSELFANGVHAATGAYEAGNSELSKEKSTAFEVGLRAARGRFTGAATIYRTRFDNYIGLLASGAMRAGDGEINPVEDPGNPGVTPDGEEIFPEYRFRPVRAVFTGMELEGRIRLLDGPGRLDLELKHDRVRATNESDGEPLPRIAPRRWIAGLDYAGPALGWRIEVIRAAAQRRVPVSEMPTDAHVLLNADIRWKAVVRGTELTLFAKGVNLTDREARQATSFLRALAPLPGRGVQVGVRILY